MSREFPRRTPFSLSYIIIQLADNNSNIRPSHTLCPIFSLSIDKTKQCRKMNERILYMVDDNAQSRLTWHSRACNKFFHLVRNRCNARPEIVDTPRISNRRRAIRDSVQLARSIGRVFGHRIPRNARSCFLQKKKIIIIIMTVITTLS